MITLLGMLPEELTGLALSIGMPKFAGRQLADWIYNKRVTSFDEMTNISLRHRALLQEKATIGRKAPVARADSKDGTRKFLFAVGDGAQYVESVFIPEGDRATLCVSSQIGCKMDCLFCMTGKQGFKGNLTSAEIVNQILSIPDSDKLTNIVYMGMGEPLDNVEAVLKSIACLTHALPEERLSMMPIERAMPIEKTIETLKRYNFSGQRRLTFEYIVFGGLNDDIAHAKALLRLIRPLECHINLIRYHRIPNVALPSSQEERMQRFADYLNAAGVPTTIRASRGEDIAAACGMLSAQHQTK